jgi:hypothetical protein
LVEVFLVGGVIAAMVGADHARSCCGSVPEVVGSGRQEGAVPAYGTLLWFEFIFVKAADAFGFPDAAGGLVGVEIVKEVGRPRTLDLIGHLSLPPVLVQVKPGNRL